MSSGLRCELRSWSVGVQPDCTWFDGERDGLGRRTAKLVHGIPLSHRHSASPIRVCRQPQCGSPRPIRACMTGSTGREQAWLRVMASVVGPLGTQRLPQVLAGLGRTVADFRYSEAELLALTGRLSGVCVAIGIAAWSGRSKGTLRDIGHRCRDLMMVGLVRLGLSALVVGLPSLWVPRPESASLAVLSSLTLAFLSLRLSPATALAMRGVGAADAIACGWRCSGRRPLAAARLALLEWAPAAWVAGSGWNVAGVRLSLLGQPWAAWDPGPSWTPAPTLACLAAGVAFWLWMAEADRWDAAAAADDRGCELARTRTVSIGSSEGGVATWRS